MNTENQMSQPWSSYEEVAPGIIVYHDVLPTDLDIINRLESALQPLGSTGYAWQPAYVGYKQLMPEYRDCVDFKFKKTDIENDKSESSVKLQGIWQDCYDRQKLAVEDYCRRFNIHNLKYWEAFNFIKYEAGHHFMEHHDHGFSYNCTLSLVAYINDDFEGGELFFRLQGITYVPKAGDVVLFPSNFMYPHQAKVVHSGTKYSLVTMLDYSKKFHTPEMYSADAD